MTVTKVIHDSKTGDILGYICEAEGRGSFFVQNKRVLVGACINEGINQRYLNTDRMMRQNRSLCG